MLKKIFVLLDFFLPSQISDQVDIATHFRARSIIGAGLLAIVVVLLLFLGATFLDVSLFIRIGMLFSLVALVTLVIFLKTRVESFERSLNIGSFVQIVILFAIVYLSSFSEKGLGFFGLIWLIPLLILTTFYFRLVQGLLFFFVNLCVLLATSFYMDDSFFRPVENLVNFKAVFLLYLFLTIATSYLLSYLFVLLNGILKEEISKQKNLLLESAKFQSLGQMASNLAHDINNPLFTIQGKMHQIRNLLSQDQLDLDKCDNIIEDVEGTILKLSQIVKGISTFARQGHGDQMVSVGLNELVRGIALMGSDRLIQSGITFDIKIEPEISLICYPSYISQVLINLLNNAIDALELSEIKLIQVQAFTDKKWIEIHIKDSGAGVPVESESKIFDSFFTTKNYGKGTGLGLSISKGLIEIHEGSLKYQREGNMTDFVIRLPSYE